MLRVPSEPSDLQGFLNSKFTDSEQFMEPIRAEWRENELLYNGSHLGFVLNNNANSPQIQANVVLSIINTEMPVVMNNIPTVNALPRDADDVLSASIVDKVMKDLQKASCLKPTMEQIGLDYKKYGNAIWSHVPKIEDGKLTGYDYRAVNPFGWFPSPDSIDLDITGDSTYQIFARVMSLEDIKANEKWENTELVKAEPNLERYLSFNRRNLQFSQSGTAKSKLSGDHALVKQIFFVDTDKEQYPTGRMVTFTNSAILDDSAIFVGFTPSKSSDFNQYLPYKMVKNHGSEHSLFGRGEPEVLKTVAHTLNEVLSATAQNIRTTGNPARMLDPAAAQEMQTEILGIPNETIEVSPGMLKILEGAGIPQATFAFIELLFRMPEIMTGAERSLRGDKPAGVESGRAILALQQQAISLLESQTRREFRRAMKEFAEFEVWAIKNFGKEVTIRDNGFNQATQDMDVDQLPDNIKVVERGGFVFTSINFDKAMKNTSFDIEITEGTSIPKGSAAYEEFLSQLMAEGTISQAERIRQSAVLEDKGRLIADLKLRDATTTTMQKEEESIKRLPEFRKLISDATKLAEDGMSPEGFANTATAMNLSTLIDTFKNYLETPEWLTFNQAYKQIVLQVFMETPEEDRQIAESQAQSLGETNGTNGTGGAANNLTELLEQVSQQS